MLRNKRWSSLFWAVVRWAVSAWALYYLYDRLWRAEFWEQVPQRPVGAWLALVAALGLGTALNWSFEASKWHYLIRQAQPGTWWQSLQQVLQAVAIGFATPGRVGEWAGRALGANEPQKALALALGGSLAQGGVTWTAALAGLLYLMATGHSSFVAPFSFHVHPSLLLAAVLIPLAVWQAPRLRPWLPWLRAGVAGRVWLWSALRYGIFLGQFWAVALFFGLRVSVIDLWALVALYYGLSNLVPVISFAEAGVRMALGVWVFGWGDIEPHTASNMPLWVWAANLLPATIAGAILLAKRTTALGGKPRSV